MTEMMKRARNSRMAVTMKKPRLGMMGGGRLGERQGPRSLAAPRARRALERLRLLSEGETRERDPAAGLVHLDAADICVGAADLPQHGVGGEDFGIDLGDQPGIAGLVQLPE